MATVEGINTEEDVVNQLIIEDDIDLDRENLMIALAALACWSRKAPRPQDHGDPVTEGVLQATCPELARAHGEWLLDAPEGIFFHCFRMKKAVFLALCRWLRIHTEAGDGREMYLEQKVMILLWLLCLGEVQRTAASFFCVHQSTVSRVYHEVIDSFRVLHNRFVIQPTADDLSPNVELDRDSMQFNGVIGAIDGTHVRAWVNIQSQGRWWSRKNQVSQNVLAAVNFEGCFVYVLAGAEGSLHDASLLRRSLSLGREEKLLLPTGRF